MNTSTWAPYVVSEAEPWNLRRVVHLHRRAGFAATWGEIERDLKEGPQASVDRLLEGKAHTLGVPGDFEPMAGTIGEAAERSNMPDRLKAWWVYRMLFSPDPLGERLALLWHNHFATSNLKVNDLPAMRRQNEIFRQHARGAFGELLSAVLHDPALLEWLDADSNHKGHPNENLARELMELFTLGISHYTETDVKEAARALTGWTVVNDGFGFRDELHDAGEKTILGRRGRFGGDDLVNILLEHPATSRRLAWRICHEFMGEGIIRDEHLESLAAGLRENGLNIGWAVETVLHSKAFFSEANTGNRVLGPVEFAVGAVRALEFFDPPPSTLVLAEWIARLGQDLFYPPNVGGWKGGRAWLTTGAVIGRANFAAALAEGRLAARAAAPDVRDLAARHGRGRSLKDVIGFVADLFLGGEPRPGWIAEIVKAAATKGTPEEHARRAVALTLASPEMQLA